MLYICRRRAYYNGKLYQIGELVEGFEGIENIGSFVPKTKKPVVERAVVLEPPKEIIEEKAEEAPEETKDIKYLGFGKWELPNGEIFKGKKTEALKQLSN